MSFLLSLSISWTLWLLLQKKSLIELEQKSILDCFRLGLAEIIYFLNF